MKIRLLSASLATLCMLVSGQTLAEPFSVGSLEYAIENVDGMVTGDFNGNDSTDVLLLGRNNDKQKQLQIITLDKGKQAKNQDGVVKLEDKVLFYDTAKLAGSDKDTLLFLEPGKISRFDVSSQKLQPLLSSDSIYRDTRRRTSSLSKLKFTFDVNEDGLSDIILQDFSQTRIFMQQLDGTFQSPQLIDMQAEMRIFRNNSAAFAGSPLFVADFDFDGQADFIYRVKSQLHVFTQNNGVFSQKAQVYPIELSAPLTDEYDNFENDHSNMVTHSFFRLEDLNHDGVLDLITKLTKSSGLLDKSSQYQIYFGGKNDKGVIGFSKGPNSVIASKGLQFELQLVDFDGDKKLDLISPSYELGVGSIIASLFSSSADLDISFHGSGENGRYNIKPNLEKELTVDFNLTSGAQVYPLMKVSDFNGDGVNDLLIGNGSKRVYLYYGNQSAKLFERRAKRYRVKLPRDGRLVTSEDFNQDGKTDLLIRYGKLDGKSLNKEMKILLAD